MPQKKKTYSNQEWLELIHECYASGLSNKEWCRMHSISIKTFYNKVSDLKKKACEVPEIHAPASRQKHEVVPLELTGSPAPCPEHPASDAVRSPTARTAVTVRMPGCSIEIADGASGDTIRDTLLALGRLYC